MSDQKFWRQADIVSEKELERLHVTLIGAGGIGSPTALFLAKMGVSHITVYDGDVVESHNRPSSMYRKKDIGKYKVEALSEICFEFADVRIEPIPRHYAGEPLSGVVISGVDSMEARKMIWKNIKDSFPAVKLYIEARMKAEFLRIHTLSPLSPSLVKWYETTLYDRIDKNPEPCTARSIIYNTCIIGGLIDNQVKKYIMLQDFPKEIIYDLVTMTRLVKE